MIITFTREELRDLLEVTEVNFKNLIRRDKLEGRLQEKGYKLSKKYKIGREVIFDLERKVEYENKYEECKTLEDYQSEWKIVKKEENITFISDRISPNGMKKSLTKIKEDNESLKDVGLNTLSRWNFKLEDSKVIKEDGYVYFKDYNDGTRVECTREEYNHYWKQQGVTTYLIGSLNKAKSKNELPKSVCDDSIDDLKFKMRTDMGYIARKYKSYAEAEMMKSFRDMLFKHIEENKIQ